MNQRPDDVLTDMLTELGGRVDGSPAMPPELGERIARRRRRHSVVGAAGGLVALVAVGAVVATVGLGSNGDGSRTVVMPGASGPTVEQSATPTPTPTPAVIGGEHAADCPVGALPLPADTAKASSGGAVLADLAGLYGQDVDLTGAYVSSWSTATGAAGGYGGIAIQDCGEQVAERTAVVSLDFPAMAPSASLSSGVVFVSKTDAGWTVWRVVR